ncbi:MAG: CRISPR-associated endoribonuclease Cas6 [Clostridium sp.]|uniref:CRISPR-associated endoribonuclease Cas6 n=1 Tax=Clostridium sp. TaxID=1506 RepID=UPI002A75C8A5|nr:CRISPR-associated endoribonuclease Cas6 [Clostridium sp.]MCI6693537.1 CRISPR-associated endoribonuclease Cas6 [Clostridium sp.]MDY2630450.1 CRISPR-associated endoribonuclease Cas6 [Clostridium sp.]
MRFSLILQLKKQVFPTEYRKVILSYIKNAISKYNDGEYYDNFFKDTVQKDYCFSVVLPKPKFTKDEILLSKDEIKIIFSTDNNYKIGVILYNSFIVQRNNPYPLPSNNFMTLKSINNEKREEISNSRAIFKTTLGSGLCVRDHDIKTNRDTYYVYCDEGFRDKLIIVLTNQLLRAGFTKKEVEEVRVNPIQCKKVVVKHYRRYIDITTGILEIQANKKVLQYFYDYGIGSRKSMGFGMIDLVTQDLG